MNIAETWAAHYGDLVAVGHLLRSALPDRWLRVHSLPDSKRYAGNAQEYAEILRRHNEVALEILGSNDEAILLAHAWGTNEDFVSTFTGFGWAREAGLGEAKPFCCVRPAGEDVDILVGGLSIHWSAGAWDTLLRDVADDRSSSVALLNPRSGEVYAPYDGGADVFVGTPQRVADLRQRWRSWLSAHPAGL